MKFQTATFSEVVDAYEEKDRREKAELEGLREMKRRAEEVLEFSSIPSVRIAAEKILGVRKA